MFILGFEDVSTLLLMVRDELVKVTVGGWIEDSREIPKRYFIMNCFDETVAFLGLILGSFYGGFLIPRIIFISLLNAGFAMAISSFTVALLVESAEVDRLLEFVSGRLGSGGMFMIRLRSFCWGHVFKSAFANGASAFLSTALIGLPYLFALLNVFSAFDAFYISLIVVIVLLLVLGFMLGRIAKRRSMVYCLLTMSSGVLTGFISMLLGLLGA